MDKTNDENVGLSCALEMFSEVSEVLEMIHNLKTIEPHALESAYDKFTAILFQYFEQPHLLDPHLDQILSILIGFIRDEYNPMSMKHETFKYMFVFVKVRGYKVVVRHLPHEVSDFEPVLKLLETLDPLDTEIWRSRYVLLIWLSIIVMLPFHMSRLDSFDSHELSSTGTLTVMNRVLNVCKTYITAIDACRDASILLTARFLTRSDVPHLTPFLIWGFEQTCQFAKYGFMGAVARILKIGKREELGALVGLILGWILGVKETQDRIILKFRMKIIQRIGLVLLKPRVVSWRYKRGTRSLMSCLQDSTNIPEEMDDSDCDDIPDEIEEIINELIKGLGHSEGVVRWSAAKGIGRVTARLPKELADDVTESVLELFNPREGEWHGGCLALAELGRRGLLLPSRLPQVVPVITEALNFDIMKGYTSFGAHIRDAACYVCWAFARAYDKDDLEPYVAKLASALLVVACFDREINCRRAASAAFQENVGRQGTFPHGIEILTVADFFAVGIRTASYLQISVYIAQFSEYTISLIDHIINKKVDHWDTQIRELSAKALHNLTSKDPDYIRDKCLPKLLQQTKSIDLNARHGAILAIGEIVNALEGKITDDILLEIRELIPYFRERFYFRGLGGELMHQACASLIENCAKAKMCLDADTKTEWYTMLNDCLKSEVDVIRSKATSALAPFLNEYFEADIEDVIQLYTSHLTLDNEVTRMGFASALSVLPQFMIKSHESKIIEALIEVTRIQPNTVKWAQSRREALKALGCFTPTNATFDACFSSLGDYTQDQRGDIGAWVREAAMTTLQKITPQKPEFIEKVLAGVARQAVERIGRTRALAGSIFAGLLYDPVFKIPDREELVIIFPEDVCKEMNWNSEGDTFPKFVELLRFNWSREEVLSGLIVSVGGLTESLVKYSSSALFGYLKRNTEAELERFCLTIVDIFRKNQFNDRVTIAMFGFLDRLFTSGCISDVLSNSNSTFATDIFNLTKAEIAECKGTYKLIDSVNVLCQLIQVRSDVCLKSLSRLTLLLCNRQKYIRKTTSSKLYEALLVYGDDSIIPDVDEAMNLLSTTDWEDNVEQLRPIRNRLCELFGIKPPTIIPKK